MLAGVTFPVLNDGRISIDARFTHGFTQPYDILVVHEKVLHKNLGLRFDFTLTLTNKKVVALTQSFK